MEFVSPSPPPPAKVALVTGGARRIGREIALALARNGWDVAVHYGASEREATDTVMAIRELGRQAIALQCDLAGAADTDNLLTQAAEKLGGVHCVVNNASVFDYDTIDSLSEERFDRHMRTNLLAPLQLARALHRLTPESGQAVVINLLDQKLFNPNPDYLSYTLSKAGLHSATTLLAQALAPRVRVVGIAPGITLVSGDQTGDEFASAHTVTPLGRSSTPADIADAVCYVANASAITGTTLVVDGGQHLLPLARDVMFLARK